MKRKDFDFGSALKGYLGAMENYWISVRDAQRAIDVFAVCNGWVADNTYPAGGNDYRDDAGRITLTYRNECRDATVYVSFSWYTMQSGRKEITAYVAI